MEDAAPQALNTENTPRNAPEKQGAAPAQCVLLSAHDPPADLSKALDHKGIRIQRAATPEVALALIVRAAKASQAAGKRSPIILVCVEPDTLGDAGPQLVRAAHLYAPHAVAWRFDARRSPQLSAWRLPAPTPTVRPQVAPSPAPAPATPKPSESPTGEPRLRLVNYEQTFRAPPPPPGAPLFVGPGIPLASGSRRGKDAPVSDGESGEDPPAPPVSDAEMSMLLSGNPKTDPRTPRRT